MSSKIDNAIYSPYGAYELKSTYQRNFVLGTAAVAALVVLLVGTAWAVSAFGEDDYSNIPTVTIKTIKDLGPPPTITKKPPQVQVQQPDVAMPKVGIPKPVADDEVLDEDVVIASREELADIVAPDITAGSGGDVIVDISDDEFMPGMEEFVAVEIEPEMIHQEKPIYPRLADEAGITGIVTIKALVDEEGNVLRANVYVSSGVVSLDEAAVKAAFKCKYKPGIQNGRPVKVWVTYKNEFEGRD